MMAEEEKGFTIRDRRMFSESSDQPEAAEGAGEEAPAPEDAAGGPEVDAGTGDGPEPEDVESPLPQINFSTFVFSLNSSALVHLGVIEDPGTGQKVKSLPLAKQTIDILGMLEEKTRGNLTTDEENLLKNMLHDLRLMYVKEKR
jgi:hypothetical protein